MNKIWNELLQFETRDLVERFIKKRHGKDLSAERALQITSNFIQGRAYFESAENSSITVKPLLQYYGVMALSKGLILSLDFSKTEAQLKSSHGLEIKNWNGIIKNKKFENLEITIGDGTFWELITTTNNKNYLRGNTSIVNYVAHATAPKKGIVFTLKQLIQYFPDLKKEYYSWIEEELNFEVFKSINTDLQINKVHVVMEGKVDKSKIELYFPKKYCPGLSFELSNPDTLVVYEENNWYPNVSQRWHGAFNLGDVCVIPTLPDDKRLNLISSMYMISYVFGMMARYYPTAWMSLKRVEKGDKIYPFVHRILDFIHEKFPLVVLDFLNAPYEFEK